MNRRSRWWSTSSGRIELRIAIEDVRQIARSGDNEADVIEVSKRPYMAKQLTKIKPEVLAEELREYGGWDDDKLNDNAQNLQRILWIAAWDVFEEMAA